MKFTMVSPTTMFRVSQKIIFGVFVILIARLFVPMSFLTTPFTIGLLILAIGFGIVNLFCKRYVEIGILICHENNVVIDYQNGMSQLFEITLLKKLKVEIASFRGEQSNWRMMPETGCDNKIEIITEDKIHHYFRMESMMERKNAFQFMKKWTEINKNVSVQS